MSAPTANEQTGAGKASLKDAIGNACFRFRAISVVPVLLAILFFCRPLDLGRFNSWLSVLGLAAALAGALTRIVAVGFSKPRTSGRENYLKAEHLNTSGLYSIVRNPLYVGNFLIYNGVLLAYASPAGLALFNLFFVPNYYFIIHSEERYLEKQFGDEYRAYLKAVPRILPRFSLYRKNDYPFSAVKAVIRERGTTLYWVFFYAVVLLLKQYWLGDGAIEHFWWHAVPVLALFALHAALTLSGRSRYS